jgi:hypothetical protein
MRVPEDGDEFVGVDLRFNRGESGVAALVCERRAHWSVANEARGGKRREEGRRRGETGERSEKKWKDALGEGVEGSRTGGTHELTLHKTDIAMHLREREFS